MEKIAKKFAICAPSHNFVELCLRKWAHIDNWKNLLNSNMVNFGPLAAEIYW